MRAIPLLLVAAFTVPLLGASATACLPLVPGESCREAWAVHDDALLWQLATSPDSTAAYAAGGHVRENRYVTGVVRAHDVRTGTLAWEWTIGVPEGREWTFASRVLALPPAPGADPAEPGPVVVLWIAGFTHPEIKYPVIEEVRLTALDPASGAPRWERRISNDGAYAALAVGPAGMPLVLLHALSGPMVAAYAPRDGAELWRTPLPRSNPYDAYVTLAAAGGRALVGGFTVDGWFGGPRNALVLGLDATDGRLTWQRTWGVEEVDEYVWFTRTDAAGEVGFVAGRAVPAHRYTGEWIVHAFDLATGETRWERTYVSSFGPTARLTGFDIAPDGSRAFLGGLAPTGRVLTWQYTVAAFDASTGAFEWDAHYQGPGRWNDVLWGLAVSPDGSRVYATGESYRGGSTIDEDYDWLTLSLVAADGDLAWAARFDGPPLGWEVPSALAVTPNGAHVLVTGPAADGSGNRSGLAAYDVAAEDAAGAGAVSVVGSRPVPPAVPRDAPPPPGLGLLPRA